jgi:hypothetical protein
MPTVALTSTAGPHPYSTTGKAVTMAAADVANGNHIVATASQLVIAHNTGASSRTVTITSVALPTYARVGDVSAVSLAAGEIRVFKLPDVGWKNTDGKILISANNAEVKFGVVDLTQET